MSCLLLIILERERERVLHVVCINAVYKTDAGT